MTNTQNLIIADISIPWVLILYLLIFFAFAIYAIINRVMYNRNNKKKSNTKLKDNKPINILKKFISKIFQFKEYSSSFV